MARRARGIALTLWVVFGALSFAFAYTDGLAYSDPGIPIAHVRELQSSGSDDDLCIEMGVVFGLAWVAWGASRIRRRFGGADAAVHVALVVAQSLFLFAIEAGSIPQTLLRDRNGVLGAWIVTFAALATCVGVTALATMNAGERTETTSSQ